MKTDRVDPFPLDQTFSEIQTYKHSFRSKTNRDWNDLPDSQITTAMSDEFVLRTTLCLELLDTYIPWSRKEIYENGPS